jgi:hypothetical protein
MSEDKTAEHKIRESCRENAQLICDQSQGAFPVVEGMEDLLYSLCQRVVYQERQAKAELERRLGIAVDVLKAMKYTEMWPTERAAHNEIRSKEGEEG